MWRWTILFVLTYLFFLIFTLPVASLYGWLSNRLPETVQQRFVVEKIQGNLWQGEVSGRWQNRVIPPVQWQWQPWQLVVGKAQFYLKGKWQRIPIQGYLALAPWQPFTFYQLQGKAPVQAFLANTGFIGSGEVTFSIQKLIPQPLEITAQADWQGANLMVLGQTISLGQLDLAVQTVDNKVEGKIDSQDGQVVVAGTFTLRGRQLQGEVTLTPTQTAPASIRELLQAVATPAADGSVTIPLRRNF